MHSQTGTKKSRNENWKICGLHFNEAPREKIQFQHTKRHFLNKNCMHLNKRTTKMTRLKLGGIINL